MNLRAVVERIPRRAWAVVGVAVVVFAALWIGYRMVYGGPMAEKRKRINEIAGRISQLNAAMERQFQVRKTLKEAGATTLASKEDMTEHLLRTGLSRIATEAGLAQVEAMNVPVQAQINPAANRFPPSLQSRVRGRPDFSVIRGQLKGTGSLEQVLVVMAAVEAQPWVHRVEGFSIRPLKGDRVELKLDVATLLIPDFGPKDAAEPRVVEAAERSRGMVGSITAKNIFREPSAESPAAARPVAQAAPPAPPTDPYAEWRLTGVLSADGAVEAMFVNSRTNERVSVAPGGKVHDATLVSGRGEVAVVEIEGKKFEVWLGQTLASRKPAG